MKYHMEQAQVEHLSCLACALETVMNVQPLSNISDMQALEEHLSSLLSARNYNSTPEVEDCKDVSMKSLQGAAAAPPEMYSPKKEKTFEYPGTLESEALSELRNKVANQQQYILELRSKVSHLENSLQDIRTELRDTKQELRCRVCEGSYIWRLNNYQKLREEAMAGGSNCVLHSPGFYTSYNGYLFCIRLNLNGVETAQGTHLSLFIHLMRSENDDILSWPFTGKIVLSILDQSSNVNKRKPITETLVAKPGLAAFQRPTSYRNHKGFGFMEFAPISFLESSDREFIKSDTLLIRADIKPTPNMS